MKRISLWLLSTLSVVVLLFGYHTSTSGPMATSASSALHSSRFSASTSTSSSSTGSSTGSDAGAGTPSSTGSDTPAATAKTVTGDVAQTQWGPVQVELTVTGTQISNVSVLQYPSGNGKDEEINAYALPILTQETITAQGASIDMVSGATVTSDGYIRSLQSALDQAGI